MTKPGQDIVERLREANCTDAGYPSIVSHPNLSHEAADEIERLRNPWQDISTAPKDGSLVLLWDEDIDGVKPVFWSNKNHEWLDESYVDISGEDEKLSVGELTGWKVYAATHRMPLPKAPEGE